MEYYSTFGHGDADSGKAPPTLAKVIENERLFPNSTVDAKRLIRTISLLGAGRSSKTFLDVGCGFGFFSAEALRQGFDVQALELASNERCIAKQMTGLDPICSSFEEYQCPRGSLGVVLMSQILEHALDVNLWVSKAYEFLAKDGILAIALPNYSSIFRRLLQERDPFVCPPTHLNFFNAESLSHLMTKHGFYVEKVQWVSRLPKSSFERRVPGLAKPILPLIHLGTRMSLGLIDMLRMGMIISVYGRKKS
jgi:2-polyprenyl-3-methyl-5-hydroxy-6-metoxy-1,4-benzoquinol methylase